MIISDTIEFQRQYRCHLWFVESIQFQEFLRTTMMKDAAKAGVALPCMPVNPTADKVLRIERLQPPIKAGLIRINPNQTMLIDQLQQFPNGDHDDGPDCLDMLWQYGLQYSAGAHGGGGLGAGLVTVKRAAFKRQTHKMDQLVPRQPACKDLDCHENNTQRSRQRGDAEICQPMRAA
ncbi:MAG: phage terminase large subunit [Ahrensia sp.]|nr:phage terminase large subunit [Ahrensia sp.]